MTERQQVYDTLDVALAGDLMGGTHLPEVGEPVGAHTIRVESRLDGVKVASETAGANEIASIAANAATSARL